MVIQTWPQFFKNLNFYALTVVKTDLFTKSGSLIWSINIAKNCKFHQKITKRNQKRLNQAILTNKMIVNPKNDICDRCGSKVVHNHKAGMVVCTACGKNISENFYLAQTL